MMNNFEHKLIIELQKDGRTGYTDLARRLGVSEATIRRRLRRLLDRKLIRIVAEPNLSALGYGFMSMIGMQVKMSDLRKVADTLAKEPNVCHLAFVTGRYDLVALVVGRSHKDLANFMEKTISVIPSILRTETFVNLAIIKGEWSGTDTTQLIHELDDTSPRRPET